MARHNVTPTKSESWWTGLGVSIGAGIGLARTRADVTTGAYVPKSEQTFAEYVDSWLRSRRHAVRPKTVEG